jgi:hypothetical protein
MLARGEGHDQRRALDAGDLLDLVLKEAARGAGSLLGRQRGGQSRVLSSPGAGTFAITATATRPIATSRRAAGGRRPRDPGVLQDPLKIPSAAGARRAPVLV